MIKVFDEPVKDFNPQIAELTKSFNTQKESTFLTHRLAIADGKLV